MDTEKLDLTGFEPFVLVTSWVVSMTISSRRIIFRGKTYKALNESQFASVLIREHDDKLELLLMAERKKGKNTVTACPNSNGEKYYRTVSLNAIKFFEEKLHLNLKEYNYSCIGQIVNKESVYFDLDNLAKRRKKT